MNITRENMSNELLETCKHSGLPDKDIPEIKGLMKVLDVACKRNGLAYHLEKGPRDLQTDAVSYYEPYKIILPFNKVTLCLLIAPGEFQWILRNEKKEPKANRDKVVAFKGSILGGTKDWLREGNRLNGAYDGK
jgi:hypothetical protein